MSLESLRHDKLTGPGDVIRRGDELAIESLLGHRPSPRRLRWVGIAVALVVLTLGLAAVEWLMASPEPEYVTESIRRGPLKVTVSAMGKLAPTNRVEVGTELSGIIARILVDNNDRVTKGQVLAELDPSKLDDTVLRAQAALRIAEANVETAEATVSETRANLVRLQQLWRQSNGKAPAKAELETAEAAFARAQATSASAVAEVSRARAQLSTDQTDRAKAAVRAPIDGVVLTRQAEPGQTVAASFQTPVLFTIAGNLTTMKLEISIDEADVGRVKPGQLATFTVDAFPERIFPAEIVRINLGPKTASSAQGLAAAVPQGSLAAATSVVTYAAVLSVSNADGSLRPGMTATATIVTDDRKDALLAPNAAFRFKPTVASEMPAAGGLFASLFDGTVPGPSATEEQPISEGPGRQRRLYVMGADGELSAISVKAGATDGRQTEILEGQGSLIEGAEVVTGRKVPGA
ncbi:efflux RND transporter periplasmic adaptor subunit [Boseaceae bacterium BT-24-1]|nr:efflux RND transporter periplasmic adaptor subunit [Boseaceae bacterium BT-24-1]